MTLVKICGVTNIDDARSAVDAGADMIGLIFYPPSSRYVTPEQARKIVASLPSSFPAVGVFVNEDVETITRIVRATGVQRVQLHGVEGPELCHQLPWPVFKTFRFTADIQPQMMRHYRVAAFLIEGFHPGYYGGSDTQADWHLVAPLRQYGRIILAGGLTPDNVRDAIRVVRPYAVDVCTGVEALPGKKDHDKVRSFIASARVSQPNKA